MAAAAAAEGLCAYCAEKLSPWERCCCLDCGVTAGGAWFACSDCAQQRLQAEAPREAKRHRADTVGNAGPCFEPGHRFSLVVPPTGWLILHPGEVEGRATRLQRFLRDYPLAGPPAGTSCSPVAWVAVKAAGAAAPVGPLAGGRGGGGAADRSPQSHGEQQRAVLKDWEAEQQIGSPSAKAAMQIGRRHGITSGKWLIYPSKASETAVWSAIAHLVQVEGMPGVHLAKIAAGPQQGWSRVICLYTQDFDDQEEIMAAAERLAPVLRAAMPDRKSCKLSYKPDIMTRLDLYKGNAWNINVACYTYKAF